MAYRACQASVLDSDRVGGDHHEEDWGRFSPGFWIGALHPGSADVCRVPADGGDVSSAVDCAQALTMPEVGYG